MAVTSLTTTRLMGLSSNMDTETIVKNLMKIEQMKLNRELRAKTTLQWRQDALKSVANDMKTFKSTFLTTLGADAMLSSGAYTSYNVSLSGTKKDAVSVRGTAEAAMNKVIINKITQLAAGATLGSSAKVSAAGQTELSEGNIVKLGALNFANSLFVGEKTIQVAKTQQVKGEHGLMFKDAANNVVYKTELGSFVDAEGNAVTVEDESKLTAIMENVTTPYLNADGEEVFLGTNGKTYYKVGENQFRGTDGIVYTQSTETDAEGNEVTKYTYVNDVGETVTADNMNGVVMGQVRQTVMEDKVVADDTIAFAINGVDFEFTKDTTLAQMLSAVNNSAAGVNLTYSRLTDSFSITTKETGANTSLSIENKRGNAFGVNGDLKDANGNTVTVSGSAFGIQETAQRDAAGELQLDADGKAVHNAINGKNAVVYINDTRVERSANGFTIDGISYTLNFTTGTESAAEKDAGKLIDRVEENEITANLSKNVDASVDKIKKFVEGYNTMVKKLYSLITEKKESKYYALTDEEKSGMTESQVKEWEEMAKKGLLKSDRDIQGVLTKMREAFYSTVQGVGLSPQDIGLRTAYGSMNGEITINENDLRAALEKDSDQVMRVFMNDSDEFGSQGLIYRLDEILKTYTGDTQNNTLNSIDRDMRNLNSKISKMEDRMIVLEEKYYMKYAAMETALSKMQSQSNSITNLLSSLSK